MTALEGWPLVLAVLAIGVIVAGAWLLTVTIGGFLLSAGVVIVALVVAGYLLYAGGGRVHDKLRHGKPIRRGRRRRDRSRRRGGNRNGNGGRD